MPGKRVQIDDFQDLADEAFRDLLRKHGRPIDLKAALRQSAGASAEVVPLRGKRKGRRRPKSD
jgi:uncharacterized protein with von Willebrand factor type A (vWA) domain